MQQFEIKTIEDAAPPQQQKIGHTLCIQEFSCFDTIFNTELWVPFLNSDKELWPIFSDNGTSLSLYPPKLPLPLSICIYYSKVIGRPSEKYTL